MIGREHLEADVSPHPDGVPYRKACRECAFRTANPQKLSEEDFEWMNLQRELGGFTFYCAHRVADGFNRECACWAALERGRAARPGFRL